MTTAAPPKVTFITPTHNRAMLLARTMESVLRCGYPNLQYVVVDDASTDHTASVVRDFMERYKGTVTYIRNEQNMGESASINRGCKIAEGAYIATLSDDDFLLANWFEVSVPFMENRPDVVVGYPDWHIIDEQDVILGTIIMPEYEFVRLFASCSHAPGAGVIIRASVLQGLEYMRSPAYRFVADYAMWLTLATKGAFARIPHITTCWRCHPGSGTVTAGTIQKARELEQATENFLMQSAALPMVQVNARKLRTHSLLRAAHVLMHGGYWRQGCGYIVRALAVSAYWSCVLAGCYLRRIVLSCRFKSLRKRIRIT